MEGRSFSLIAIGWGDFRAGREVPPPSPAINDEGENFLVGLELLPDINGMGKLSAGPEFPVS